MSSILDFTVTEAKRLLPTAIQEAGSFYQESLRETELSAMVPAMIGRGAYRGTTFLDKKVMPYAGLVGSLGLAWAMGLYKGLGVRTWIKDWASVAALPTVNAMIDALTPNVKREVQNEKGIWATNQNYSVNQERARFALKTIALMVQTCAFYKLQNDRNGSLCLKPYLYYGATVTLLSQLTNRYAMEIFRDAVKECGFNPSDKDGYLVLKGFLAIALFARIELASLFAKNVTGETVQVSRMWEILTFSGVALAHLIP